MYVLVSTQRTLAMDLNALFLNSTIDICNLYLTLRYICVYLQNISSVFSSPQYYAVFTSPHRRLVNQSQLNSYPVMAAFTTITKNYSHKTRRRQRVANLPEAFFLLLISIAFTCNATNPIPCQIITPPDQPPDQSTSTQLRSEIHCNDSSITAISEFITKNGFTQIKLNRIIQNSASNSLRLFHLNSLEKLSWIESELTSGQVEAIFSHHFRHLYFLDLHDNLLSQFVPKILTGAPSLHTLYLSGNHLASLPQHAFYPAPSLVHLDLSHNRLSAIDIDGSGLFAQNAELLLLDLSHNEIADLPFVAFDGLTNLRQLNLAFNNLTVVRFQLFRDLPNIERIDMSHNRLIWFPDNFFTLNRKLQEMRLNGNRLNVLSKHSLFGLKNLHTLDLSDNQLTNVDRNALESLASLRHLNLSGNRFDSISSAMFNGLVHLRVLDLSRTAIRTLPNGIFANTFELEELIIEHTSIEHLGNWIARNNATVNPHILTHLRIVRIQNNVNLRDIDGVTFASTPALEELHLKNNRLTSLPKELGEVVGLRVLNVSGNSLHSVPWQLGNLKELDTLSMEGNKFACDCRMFWLVSWLEGIVSSKDLLNSELSRLKCMNGYPGEMLPVLQQLHCTKPVTLHATESSMHRLRSDAVLECSFTGNPAPDMLWVTPTNQILRYYADPDAKPVLLEAGDEEPRHSRDPIEFQMLIGANLNNYTTVTKAVGVSLLDNGALKVHTISRRDSGIYTCYGYNMMGNATANIR